MRRVALLLLLSACGTSEPEGGDTDATSSDPFLGLWKGVTWLTDPTCADLTATEFFTPYYRVDTSTEVPGAVELVVCRSATDCDPFAQEGFAFTWDATREDWRYADTFAEYGNEGLCSRGATLRTLRINGQGQLRLDETKIREYESDLTSAAKCDRTLDDFDPDPEDYEPLATTGVANDGKYECARWLGEPEATTEE